MKKNIKKFSLPPLRALWNMGPKTAYGRKVNLFGVELPAIEYGDEEDGYDSHTEGVQHNVRRRVHRVL